MFCLVLLLSAIVTCTSARSCRNINTCCKPFGSNRFECGDRCDCIEVNERNDLILDIHPGVREVHVRADGVAVHLIVQTEEQMTTMCRPGIADIKLGGDDPVSCKQSTTITSTPYRFSTETTTPRLHLSISPQPTSGQPTSPQPTSLQSTSLQPTSPQPTSPQPTSPQPTSPQPTTLQPTSPQPTSPQPTFSQQRVMTPPPTSPQPTSPQPTSPPQPTTPQPTSHQPTSPQPRVTSVQATTVIAIITGIVFILIIIISIIIIVVARRRRNRDPMSNFELTPIQTSSPFVSPDVSFASSHPPTSVDTTLIIHSPSSPSRLSTSSDNEFSTVMIHTPPSSSSSSDDSQRQEQPQQQEQQQRSPIMTRSRTEQQQRSPIMTRSRTKKLSGT